MRKNLFYLALLCACLVLPDGVSAMRRGGQSMMQLPSAWSDGEESDANGSMMAVDTDFEDIFSEEESSSDAGDSVLSRFDGCKSAYHVRMSLQSPHEPIDTPRPQMFSDDELRRATQDDRVLAECVLLSTERCRVLSSVIGRLIEKCADKGAAECGQGLLEFIGAAMREHDFVTKRASASMLRGLHKVVKSAAPDGQYPSKKKHALARAKLKKIYDAHDREETFQRRLARVKDWCSEGDGDKCAHYLAQLAVVHEMVEQLIQRNDDVIIALRQFPRDVDELAQAFQDATARDERIFGAEKALHKKKSPWRVILGVLANAEARP